MRRYRTASSLLVPAFLVAACAGGGQSAPSPDAPQAPAAAVATPPVAKPSAAGGVRTKGEWPQWRGPRRDGVSSDTGLLASWPAEGPPLLWKSGDIGKGYSSVAISDGVLYTLGERSHRETLVALDTADGREIWSRAFGPEYDNDRGGGPRSTPTVVGDRIYVLGVSGDLVCFKTADGEPVWQVNILQMADNNNLKWGISESPLVDGDHVIVATGDPEGSIVAFDRQTGAVVWRSTGADDDPGYASAIVADVGGVRQIIHFTEDSALGVRAADGKVLWRYEDASNDTANCTTPIYRDGHVFLTSGYDTGAALLRLTSHEGTTKAEEVYFTRDMMNHHGGVVLVGDHLYGFSNNMLTCMEFKTGKKVWEDRSVGKGSLTAADGMLYLYSEKGVVGLARATPERYEEVSRFAIPTEYNTWAYPVVVDGRLYIRNRGELHCYDVKA
jgi:outer membrane protein assembly factor BamB